MNSEFSIYGLADLRTGQLRHVGSHVGKLAKRLREHSCHARKGKKIYVYDWMRKVASEGSEVEIFELEVCSGLKSLRLGRTHSKEARLEISRKKSGLTLQQQETIVEFYKDGRSSRKIAKYFNVSEGCVRNLLAIFDVPSRRRGNS